MRVAHIYCPSCHCQVSAESFGGHHESAICTQCHQPFALPGPGVQAGLSVQQNSQRLTIRYRELTQAPPSEIAWIVALGGVVAILLMLAWRLATGGVLLAYVGSVGVWLAALAIGYTLVQALVSDSVITLDKYTLRCIRTPLPDLISRSIDTYRIEWIQLASPYGATGDLYKDVVVHTDDGNDIAIRRFVPQTSAHYIVQALQTHLHTLRASG